MSPKHLDAAAQADRRHQILEAAMACFARRGFHQTTMQDISEQAGISVGLIYRYFESKEQVIATMAEAHLAELRGKLEQARQLPSLRDAVEHVLWCDQHCDVAASFLVDLFAEAGRSPHVRALVGQVQEAALEGLTQLIATSPESSRLAAGLQPRDAAEMVFHAIHGQLFDAIVAGASCCADELKQQRIAVLRRIWSVMFPAPEGA